MTVKDDKYDKEGVFTTGVIIPADEASELMEEVRQFAATHLKEKASTARLPFKLDNEVGEVTFVAKTQYDPKFFDSSGQIIASKIPKIFGGSVIAVGGTFTPYDNGSNVGIKMNLNRVQIIELATGGNNDDGGFDAVEGGYIADAVQASERTFDDSGASDGKGFNEGNF